MPMSEYYRDLRGKTGSGLLMMPSVAAVIRDEQDRILLIRKPGETLWGLPAGAAEPGETPSRALRREVFEETGLMVTPEQILGVFGGTNFRYTYMNGDQVEYTVIVFQCSIVKGRLRNMDGETEELVFFPEADMPELAIPYPRKLFQRDYTTGKSIFD
ncbi:NUDIX domain-containing protein [Paenibacillus sp. MMS20-IR301]|uniref:NUDIX domain-containing protein n=1 Tax=Paenibacillus sp. MMS20-IR301 TaxID=2895946 RepID=UPI0028EFF8D7|nr:NUDIX domain-containing protein [Paenibacillus sp. MMS20-IR301]WNS45929.1 NUDIX domain-containing protein [Paenibacillus sp. MMS20-IR301]